MNWRALLIDSLSPQSRYHTCDTKRPAANLLTGSRKVKPGFSLSLLKKVFYILLVPPPIVCIHGFFVIYSYETCCWLHIGRESFFFLTMSVVCYYLDLVVLATRLPLPCRHVLSSCHLIGCYWSKFFILFYWELEMRAPKPTSQPIAKQLSVVFQFLDYTGCPALLIFLHLVINRPLLCIMHIITGKWLVISGSSNWQVWTTCIIVLITKYKPSTIT